MRPVAPPELPPRGLLPEPEPEPPDDPPEPEPLPELDPVLELEPPPVLEPELPPVLEPELPPVLGEVLVGELPGTVTEPAPWPEQPWLNMSMAEPAWSATSGSDVARQFKQVWKSLMLLGEQMQERLVPHPVMVLMTLQGD